MSEHFPHLDADTRRRLEERGIDVEASCEALIAEVRVSPPPALLHDLGLVPFLTEREIDRHAWPQLKRRAA